MRPLTVPGDAFNAIAGIAHRLTDDFPGGFFYGLPGLYFHIMLLWQNTGDISRRCAHLTGSNSSSENRLVTAPSWSWAGWQGSKLDILCCLYFADHLLQNGTSYLTVEDAQIMAFRSPYVELIWLTEWKRRVTKTGEYVDINASWQQFKEGRGATSPPEDA